MPNRSNLFLLSEKEKRELSLSALYHDFTKAWTFEDHKAFLEKKVDEENSDFCIVCGAMLKENQETCHVCGQQKGNN